MEPTARPCTILVIESDEGCRSVVRKILVVAGYDILEATGIESAIQLLQTVAVEIVLTNAPSGLTSKADVLRRLRQNAEAAVILMSGAGRPEPGAPPLFDAFVSKPFTRDALLAAIRSVSNSKR